MTTIYGVTQQLPMPQFETRRIQANPPSASSASAELVRHALAEVFARHEAGAELDGVLVSIAEYAVSPDLKHATALVAPLAVKEPDALVGKLNKSARYLRGKISPALRQMRSMPDLKFILDTRFEDDSRASTSC